MANGLSKIIALSYTVLGIMPKRYIFFDKSSGHRVPSLLPLSFHSKSPNKKSPRLQFIKEAG
jgi:hypothetical protein